MKKSIMLVIISLLITTPVLAQNTLSKFGLSKLPVAYQEQTGYLYLSYGAGVEHSNFLNAQPQYWYGLQLKAEPIENIEVFGRVQWDFGFSTAASAKPSGQAGIWIRL